MTEAERTKPTLSITLPRSRRFLVGWAKRIALPAWYNARPPLIPLEPMPFLIVGLNHHTATLAVRERFAFAKEKIPEILRALKQRTQTIFLLGWERYARLLPF